MKSRIFDEINSFLSEKQFSTVSQNVKNVLFKRKTIPMEVVYYSCSEKSHFEFNHFEISVNFPPKNLMVRGEEKSYRH